MTTQELQTLLDLFARTEPKENPSVAELRADMARIGQFLPVPAEATVETVDANGVPGELVGTGTTPARHVLYLHGGGYVMGGPDTHRTLAYNIAVAADARCLVADYRLAPEHPFPAALDDAVAAYRWLLDNGARPETTVIAGDSAGGGLTVATLLRLRRDAIALPAAAVCLSPWTDLEGTGASIAANADKDPIVRADGLHKLAALYLNGTDARDPLASPLHGDLAGLPPLMIQVGSEEIILDDSVRLADAARQAGVDVTYEMWDRMFHVWHLFAPMLSEGREAIAAIGSFVKARTAA